MTNGIRISLDLTLDGGRQKGKDENIDKNEFQTFLKKAIIK